MEISTDIIKAHEKLSSYNTRFLDFVRQNPECLNRANYHLLELDDPLSKLQAWPTFIDKQTKNQMKEASLGVLKVLRSIPERIFGNDCEKIAQYYGISVELAKHFLDGVTRAHLERLLSRGDFILSSSGWKCIEYNVNTNLGGLDLPYLESLYLATPVISKFIKSNQVKITNKNIDFILFEHLVKSTAPFYPHDDEINIALVMDQDFPKPQRVSMEKFYQSIYDRVQGAGLTQLKGQIFICDYSQLEVRGDEVWYSGKKIHHILEWCQGFVPHEILQLLKKEKIVICNGAVSWLLSTKLNFALLSESKNSDLFTPEEKEIIEKHIPWTRKVTSGKSTYQGETIDLPEFIRSHRENLILKPLVGTGGQGIFIGRYIPGEKWNQLVDSALLERNWKDIPFALPMTERQWFAFIEKSLEIKSWVVQEYIQSPTYSYQAGKNGYAEYDSVWGFLEFGNTQAAEWIRLLPTANQSGIINCHQGAEISIVFSVE